MPQERDTLGSEKEFAPCPGASPQCRRRPSAKRERFPCDDARLGGETQWLAVILLCSPVLEIAKNARPSFLKLSVVDEPLFLQTSKLLKPSLYRS